MARRNKIEQVATEQVEAIEVEQVATEQVEQVEPITEQEAIDASVKAMTLEVLMDTLKTKSAVIRHLSAEGMTTGQIAKFMNIRYQHVRNVLITPVKKVG